ncbi:hypothetical protein WMY93_015471 [Mugilogobius chulae]|uniref:SH3 domain-binding glutamic acid-rich-like protein n=1 Tax=Mugilogobius chulae TaxID=88201 RepID=A0AAW0NQ65_9GOBI
MNKGLHRLFNWLCGDKKASAGCYRLSRGQSYQLSGDRHHNAGKERLWMYNNIPKDRQPEKGRPLPPQIFNEDHYCGDYDDFFKSKENNTVFAFLGIKSKASIKDSQS